MIIKSIIFVIFCTIGLLLLSIVVFIVIYAPIQVICFNDIVQELYNWSAILSLAIAIGCNMLIYREGLSMAKKSSDKNNVAVWKISFSVATALVTIVLVMIMGSSISSFWEKHTHKKIDSLSALVEKSGELQGQTITLSDTSIYDTAAIFGDIKRNYDNNRLKWQQYSSKIGKFSVSFPNYKIIEHTDFSSDDDIGGLINTVYVEVTSNLDPNNDYRIIYYKVHHITSIADLFDNEQKIFLKNTNGNLIDEAPVSSAGVPCRDITIAATKPTRTIKLRMMYNRSWLYVLGVSTNNQEIDNEATSYFLNSFSFNKE